MTARGTSSLPVVARKELNDCFMLQGARFLQGFSNSVARRTLVRGAFQVLSRVGLISHG